MVNKCCVPGCDSNYKRQSDSQNKKYVHTFLFPSDPELCSKWIKSIPRQNLTVSKYTVVCEKHFEESSIIRFDVIPGLNGKPEQKILRKKLKLKEGSFPTIFPNLPSYLSSSPAPQREAPEAKKRKLQERDDDNFQSFLESDKVKSFSSLKETMSDFVKNLRQDNIFFQVGPNFVFLYKLNIHNLHGLQVTFSVKIQENLSVQVWKDSVLVPPKNSKWIMKDSKLERWSQLENILSHFSMSHDDNEDINMLFEKAICLLEKVSQSGENDSRCLDFFIEQLKLSKVTPSRRRYSSQSVVFAFCLYFTSPSAYRKLRDSFLILPNVRYLQHLCQNVSCERGLMDISFLKKELACLTEKDILVNLLIDEIHVKPRLGYRGEKLIGQASNDPDNLANSIQCFMLSSIMSDTKIVVGMLPVKNMDSEFLLNSTKSIIENCSKAGFEIISIISDNNRINRKMFTMLTLGSESKLFITNPIDQEKQIFLLFDTVHLLKSIRNNWLNVKNQSQTFSFPEFNDNDINAVNRASFCDLKTLYKTEESKLLKVAHTLSWKALFPHSLERQKVSLALKIFNDSNVAALKTVGPQREDFISWEGTAKFIELICHWWDMVNVQHRFYGRNKIKPHATPFCSEDDQRLSWLRNMALWLDRWSERSKTSNEGFLSNDTYQALKHSLQSLVLLIKYLISTKKLEFVLTGKFQTDNLEGRFGQYRQLCGGNTLISVEEALQSEKKLRVSSLLNIHSLSKGDIPIREFLIEFSPEVTQRFDPAFVSSFPIDKISVVDDDSMKVIVYVAGYVAKKLLSKIDCSDCCEIIGDKKKPFDVTVDVDLLTYFDHLNRGGLVYPSNVLVSVLQLALSIMNVAVSSMENEFLSLKNQKRTLIQINKEHWPDCEFAPEIYAKCVKCGKDYESIFLIALQSFVNILLNNYSKKLTETCKDIKSIQKKVQKFN